MKATIEMTYRWNCFSPKQWHQAVNVITIKNHLRKGDWNILSNA